MRRFENFGPRLAGAVLSGALAAGVGALFQWLAPAWFLAGPEWLSFGCGAMAGYMNGSGDFNRARPAVLEETET